MRASGAAAVAIGVIAGAMARAAALCALLAGCSSVGGVNDQIALAGSEHARLAGTPQAGIDPSVWIRPAPTEYHIGPRDLLEIDIFELEEPGKSKLLRARVSQAGVIVLPLIGEVVAAGRTVGELQGEIERRLAADYLVNPTVGVLVAEYQARRVTVLGAVQDPGSYYLKENSTTLVDVLALAGGPTEKAGACVYVLRGAPTSHTEVFGDATAAAPGGSAGAREAAAGKGGDAGPGRAASRLLKIDLTNLVERGDLQENCVLADGDVVHVPPAALVFVTGQVQRGGAFPLRSDMTLLQAIALAGGLKEEATPSATELIRVTPEGRVRIPVDLSEIEAGSDKDLHLQAEDVVVVNETATSKVVRGFGSVLRGLFHIGYSVH